MIYFEEQSKKDDIINLYLPVEPHRGFVVIKMKANIKEPTESQITVDSLSYVQPMNKENSFQLLSMKKRKQISSDVEKAQHLRQEPFSQPDERLLTANNTKRREQKMVISHSEGIEIQTHSLAPEVHDNRLEGRY